MEQQKLLELQADVDKAKMNITTYLKEELERTLPERQKKAEAIQREREEIRNKQFQYYRERHNTKPKRFIRWLFQI